MENTPTIKRRAKKACIACRARKVRCDVTRTGTPCTNCQLDTKTCQIKERTVRRCGVSFAKQAMQQHVFDSSSFAVPGTSASTHTLGSTERSAAKNYLSPGSILDSNQPEHCSHSPPSTINQEEAVPSSPEMLPLCQEPMTRLSSGQTPSCSKTGIRVTEPVLSVSSKACAPTTVPRNWSYRSHPFLTIGNASSLSSQDLSFLEIKGALHVPSRPLLDEFMRQYFLHVHPMLPLIDEGDFWDTYQQQSGADIPTETIPLLLFQAMIFASCTYVPEAVVRSLGYDGIRSARASFYHRTKLLFDFATEKEPLVLSQAAILMTLWCSPEIQSTHSNSMWLQIGIQHARFVDAHRAWGPLPQVTSGDDPVPRHDIRILKRLWWCCLVRDCSLSVGIGRHTQIAMAYPPLCVFDFENDIGRSQVNDAKTKHMLAVIFTRLTHLCNTLSHVLRHMWHCDNRDGPVSIEAATFADCRLKLQAWLKQTQLEIEAASQSNELRQHCVIIHTNQMFIFYYGCLSFLSRQELLHRCAGHQASAGFAGHSGLGQEMQEAVLGTVLCFEELTRLDLARYLQASAMAFISLPLLFHILETKFFHPKTHDLDQRDRQNRLQVLIDAIKEYRVRYEGAEWISSALRHVVGLVECAPPARSLTSWTDLLAQTPSYCLSLTLTIDISLNQAKFPQDRDFPTALRGVLEPSLRTVKEPRADRILGVGNVNGLHSGAAKGIVSIVGAAPDTGDPLEILTPERESPPEELSLEDVQPTTEENEDSNNIAYPHIQHIYPALLEMTELNERPAMDVTAPGQSSGQCWDNQFDAASDQRLEIDGMILDLHSSSHEDALLDILL